MDDRWGAVERARTPEELMRAVRGRTRRRLPLLVLLDGIVGLVVTVLLLAAVADALLD